MRTLALVCAGLTSPRVRPQVARRAQRESLGGVPQDLLERLAWLRAKLRVVRTACVLKDTMGRLPPGMEADDMHVKFAWTNLGDDDPTGERFALKARQRRKTHASG